MDRAKENPVRKLTLEHWFVNYQLQAVQKQHMNLPGSMDIDVTDALARLQTANPQGVLTALVIKAAALVLEENPHLNCIYSPSFFGPRMAYPENVAINVPIRVKDGERHILSAHIAKEPQTKSVEAIRTELRDACARGLDDKPITRFVARKPNTFINRMLLRLLHIAVYNMPHLYVRRGAGAVSVSSLIFEGRDAVPLTMTAFGPTAFTIVLASTWTEGGRTFVKVGVAFDHFTGNGDRWLLFAKRLAGTLNGEAKTLHAKLLDQEREAPQPRMFQSPPAPAP